MKPPHAVPPEEELDQVLQSHTFINQAIDVLEEVFFVFTAEGQILRWNERLREVTGYTDEDIRDMHPVEFVPGEEQPLIREQITTVLEEGKTRFSAHLLRKDGVAIPYEFTGALLKIDDYHLICGTGRDITRQREAQEARTRQIEVIEQKRNLIRLMQEVTRAANETQRLETALQVAVDAVCKYTGWPIGHVYLPSSKNAGKLRPTALWCNDNENRFPELRRATEETTFHSGEGLPGRVLASGEEAWIPDITKDANFPRAALAADLGVRGAFAFPVKSGQEVVAVLEFFSIRPEPLDEDLLEAMGTIGTQLGRVAEREHSARQLEASEKRYRSLMETATDAIIVANSQGRIIDWNRGAQHVFGYQAEEVLGESLEVLIPERHRQPHREGMARVNRTGEGRLIGRTVELEGLRKGGEEFPLELSLSSWMIGDKRFFASIIRDISERRRADEALRQSEEKFRTLAEESQVGIVLIQEEGFRYVNPAFAGFFSYRPEELVGVSPRKVVHRSDWPMVEEKIRQSLLEKKVLRYSFRGQDKAGETVHLDAYGGQIEYERQPTILGTVLDVTDQRRLEQEILQIQEQERRRIGQDLHDRIGANLSGVTMMLHSVVSDLEESNAAEAKALEEILEQLRETTADTRRLSRGLNPVHLDKEGLSAALQRLTSNASVRTDTTCTYEEDAPVPRLPEEMTSHLYWIAQEALNNALRHGKPENIWIRLQDKDDHFMLTIEDNGQGFDPSAVDEGMGWHTMRYRAEIIGGRLIIRPRQAGGTVVLCMIPRDREA